MRGVVFIFTSEKLGTCGIYHAKTERRDVGHVWHRPATGDPQTGSLDAAGTPGTGPQTGSACITTPFENAHSLHCSGWLSGAEGARSVPRRARVLLVAVGDAAFGQVVWRELQRDPVAIHHLDAIAPESSGHGRQHGFAYVEFDRKHSGLELFDDLTHYFDGVFFGQTRIHPLPAIAATAAVAATAAAGCTVAFGAGFIDVERSAVQVLAIEAVDGAVAFRIAAHLDEREAAGLAGIPIGNDVDTIDGSVRCEQGTE